MIEVTSFSLLRHWKDSLNSCPDICAKVYRFLLLFYGEQATQIAFPPQASLTPALRIDVEAQPKLPKSPEQLRFLLIKIAEAVSSSVPNNPW
jgi:hypothetical protein